MKSKTLISVCVNVLIGVLFSFPVFSAQNYTPTGYISKFEYDTSDTELCINNEADTIDKFEKDFLKKKNLFKTASKTTSKVNSVSLNVHNYLIYLYSDLTFSYKNNLYPTFVDISYLIELRVTKMLC